MSKKKKSEKHQHKKPLTIKPDNYPNWHLPLIFIITFLAYIPALNAGFVNWDDGDYVGENPLIKDLSRLPDLLITPVQGNHHPLTMFSLAINYAISGDDAWSYHLFNIIFHLVNCFLVYKLAFRISNQNAVIAFITSLLFGIHPLHVESVAWISERKDVLYTLFFLAGHIAYTKYLDTGIKKQFWLTLCFLVLSLLSKPAAVIFPVSLLSIDIIRNREINFRLVFEKAIFFIPAIAIGLITILAQKEVGATTGDPFGTMKNVLFGFYGLLMYFIKMILPVNQSTFYPFPPINTALPAIYYIAPLFTLLLAALFFYGLKKNRMLAFGISFYVINLLLVLQVFSVGSAIIAERYTYVPYIGMFFIAGYLLNMAFKADVKKVYYIMAPVTVLLAVLTFLQSQIWKDGASLWDSVIKTNPSSRAYSARATLFRKDANTMRDEASRLMSQNQPQLAEQKNREALQNYQRAIDYYTKAIRDNKIDHESYNNRANIYMDLNKFDSALLDYKSAISVKPDYHVAIDNIGSMYARRNMNDSALVYLSKAIQLKPNYKTTYSNRGLTYMAMKRYAEALNDWQRYIQLDPDAADVVNTIGLCLRMLGRYNEALVQINKSIQMSPQGEFFMNRSYTYAALKNYEMAKQDAITAKQKGVPVDAAYAASLGIR